MKNIKRDDCPSNSFSYGNPSGCCWGDGHYLCKECSNLKQQFIDSEILNDFIENCLSLKTRQL